MAINIKMGPWSKGDRARDARGMDREGCGYGENMTLEEIYQCNHGVYVLDPRRAERHQFATWSFRGDVKLAVKISDIQPTNVDRGRTKDALRNNVYF